MKRIRFKIVLLGIFLITVVSLLPKNGQAWPPNLPNGQTLILLHGRGDSKQKMNIIQDWADPNVSPTYPIITWEKIYNIEYYGDYPDHPSEFNNVIRGNSGTNGSHIDEFGEALYIWLLGKIFTQQVNKEIYFICHSMGGLIVRYMIKTWYDYFGAQIKGVAHLGTPNHGCLSAGFGYMLDPWEKSLGDMRIGSVFIANLNANDETPDITKWYTYAGRKDLWGNTGTTWDGVVEMGSVELEGACANRRYSDLNHLELKRDWGVYTQIIYDFRYL
ncbi:MAG: esterase/lipase family protein [Candidatus Hermodarchaeota archaeon]